MSTPDYPVGYKKPPKHSRFVKGMSGNPKGRPKQSAQKSMDILQEEMGRKITANEGNKKSKITMERAVIRQLVHRAVKGETQAAKLLFQMWSNFEQLKELVTIPTPILIINPPEGPRPYPAPPIHGVDCDCHGCYETV